MDNVQNIEVGPIWNQSHAEQKAAEYVRNHPEFEWTGQWNTTQAGRMSTIQIRRRCQSILSQTQTNTGQNNPAINTQNVEVGPIRNQRHALQVAEDYVRTHPEFEWTGHWNTTIPGVMSVIQIRRRGLAMPTQTQTNTVHNNTASNTQDVEVGPLQNQCHAEQVAADYVRNHPECEWTGHWNTTRPGVMSVIQIRRHVETPEIDVGEFVWVQQPNSESPPASTKKKKTTKSKANSMNSTAVSEPTTSSNSYLPTCPICWEAMNPPKRIFQCSNGHLVCEVCRSQPEIRGCPTCRQPIMGRATAMEQLLADLQNGAQSKN